MDEFIKGDVIRDRYSNEPTYCILDIKYVGYNQYGILQKINTGEILYDMPLEKFKLTVQPTPTLTNDKNDKSIKSVTGHEQLHYFFDKLFKNKGKEKVYCYGITKVITVKKKTVNIDGEEWLLTTSCVITHEVVKMELLSICIDNNHINIKLFIEDYRTIECVFGFDEIFSIFTSENAAKHFINSEPDWPKAQLITI